jgi:hypothetical protein
MCVISGEIKRVSDTNILCGLSDDKQRQIIIYSNQVDNITKNNAMILPVPLPNTLQFHNLINYKELFSDCKNCFYDPNTSFSYGNLPKNKLKSNKLEVFNVGSYKVSIAQTIDDLERVDTSVFELSNNLSEFMKNSYNEPYFGFIICKLNVGSEKYHPFGYSHDVFNNELFVPTKHFHIHNTAQSGYANTAQSGYANTAQSGYTNTAQSGYANTAQSGYANTAQSGYANFDQAFGRLNIISDRTFYGSPNNQNIADDWSHDIYFYNVYPSQNSEITLMNKSKERWSGKTFNLDKINFPFSKNCSNFEKIEIDGVHKNIDLIIPVH